MKELPMGSKSAFSIVTVCKNALRDLQHTFDSIVRQTSPDWEWIVVDGNSDDGTSPFLDEKGRADHRITWISEPDKGLYDAMNKGIARSQGSYILFLNAGDTFASDNVLNSVITDSWPDYPDFIYGDAKEVSVNNEIFLKRAKSASWVWYGMFTHHQAMFFSRIRLGSIRYRTEYAIGADYAFVVEFLLRSKNIHRLQVPICIFKQGGLSSVHYKRGWDDQWNIRKVFLGYSSFRNFFIRCLQICPMTLRRMSPKIYSLVRFDKAT
jgi:putative colanic acid biosynthesis glycosyltransferase